MTAQFIPLYCTLIVCSTVAAVMALRWTLKLRQGTLHVLARPERTRLKPQPLIFADLPAEPLG